MASKENTRVKTPALFHLTQISHQSITHTYTPRNSESNIFSDFFSKAVLHLNTNQNINPQTIITELLNHLNCEGLDKASNQHFQPLISTSFLPHTNS